MAVKQIVLFKYQSLVQLSNFSSLHFIIFFKYPTFLIQKSKTLSVVSYTNSQRQAFVPWGFSLFSDDSLEKMPESVF